jgi:hypothetical protein
LTTEQISSVDAHYKDIYGNLMDSMYAMTAVQSSSGIYTLSALYLPAGKFVIEVHMNAFGFVSLTPNNFEILITSFSPQFAPSMPVQSFAGGAKSLLTFAGLHTNNIQNNYITICGSRVNILNVD